MIPLLIVGDAPTSGTGLGRITNDISSLVANKLNDTFRVATLGYGGITSRHLPHHHYTAEGMDGWIIPNLAGDLGRLGREGTRRNPSSSVIRRGSSGSRGLNVPSNLRSIPT